LHDVIQSLDEEDMEKEEQWKKLKSVRYSLDGFPKDTLHWFEQMLSGVSL
jgi:hypothetical protein